MPMSQEDLETALREGFPDADIQIQDLAGDGDHYRAKIVSAAFKGLPRVRQHQLVYAALKGKMSAHPLDRARGPP
jgi:stress-induced morphogen